MGILAGCVVIAFCVAVIAGCVYIWNRIPYFQCPNCWSYDIEDHSDIPDAFNRCLACGHEWKDEA